MAFGGGGVGVGIHKGLEAAVWDMPVIFGPNNQRFSEAQGLKRAEGGFEIHTPEDFEELITRFTDDAEYRKCCGDRAGAFVAQMTGATTKILGKVKF